jgi:quercetin dioxygenase-like cupin family protein
MRINDTPFGVTDWELVEATEHAGDRGTAVWRTRHFGDVRVRRVDYSPGYVANHWCSKGHVLFCLEGQLTTELADGRTFVLQAAMSYQVADDAEAHRSSTESGAKLFIVD